MQRKFQIAADTPLSALFRENHHNELRTFIESWRPCLIGDDPSIDALQLSHFEFNKKRMHAKDVYKNLLDLEEIGALKVSIRQLAFYFSEHSNLSRSFGSLYQQLKNYRSQWR